MSRDHACFDHDQGAVVIRGRYAGVLNRLIPCSEAGTGRISTAASPSGIALHCPLPGVPPSTLLFLGRQHEHALHILFQASTATGRVVGDAAPVLRPV